MIKRLFSPPIFEDQESNFRAKFINGFIWIIILIFVLGLIPNLGPNADENARTTIFSLSVLIFISFVSFFLLKRGNLNASAWLIVIFSWLGFGFQAYSADGIRDVVIIAYIATSLLASVIINWRAGSLMMILSIAAIWLMAFLEVNGILRPHLQEPIPYSRDLSLIFIAISALIYFSTINLRDAINRATKSEKNLLASNAELVDLNRTLEERVNQRTAELDNANRFNQKRARQFEAISHIARSISSVQTLSELLPQIAQTISDQFDFYHVGIFLLDERKEYAILVAANSEGGKRMLKRGHRLTVGETGIVGHVAKTGHPRIALNTGEDAVYFNNPDLPETRSEVALPLQIGYEIFGALDVQSKQTNAFSQEDVDILTTLAGQVSIAIQNARLYQQTREALIQAEATSAQSSEQQWRQFLTHQDVKGFTFDGLETTSLTQNNAERPHSLSVPLILRGTKIGTIKLSSPDPDRMWTDDEIEMVQAAAERASLALESARLLKEAQKRAAKERIIGEISANIGASVNLKNILQTAVEELGRTMPGSEVMIQFKSDEK